MSEAFFLPPDLNPRKTLAEFLAWDDGTDTRYELLDGRVFAMAPARARHAAMAARLCTAFNIRLRAPCGAFSEGGIVSSADTFLIPDVVVSCTPAGPEDRWVRNPRVIAEILSPSTKGIDRGAKVAEYRTIPSVGVILLVSTDEPRVEAWFRADRHWVVLDLVGLDEVIRVEEPALSIPLREIYEGILDAE